MGRKSKRAKHLESARKKARLAQNTRADETGRVGDDTRSVDDERADGSSGGGGGGGANDKSAGVEAVACRLADWDCLGDVREPRNRRVTAVVLTAKELKRLRRWDEIDGWNPLVTIGGVGADGGVECYDGLDDAHAPSGRTRRGGHGTGCKEAAEFMLGAGVIQDDENNEGARSRREGSLYLARWDCQTDALAWFQSRLLTPYIGELPGPWTVPRLAKVLERVRQVACADPQATSDRDGNRGDILPRGVLVIEDVNEWIGRVQRELAASQKGRGKKLTVSIGSCKDPLDRRKLLRCSALIASDRPKCILMAPGGRSTRRDEAKSYNDAALELLCRMGTNECQGHGRYAVCVRAWPDDILDKDCDFSAYERVGVLRGHLSKKLLVSIFMHLYRFIHGKHIFDKKC